MVAVMGITDVEGDCKAVEKSKYFSLHVNTGHVCCTYTHCQVCVCPVLTLLDADQPQYGNTRGYAAVCFLHLFS